MISVPRGNLSNYFMKIIGFSSSYRSKSSTLEIAYNMKNRFLVMYYYPFPPQKQSAKTIRMYIIIDSDQNLNEPV